MVNQYGEDIRKDSVLSNYLEHVKTSINPANKSFVLDVKWTNDKEIQERLRILQCISFYYGLRHPCRTSLVNVRFSKEKGKLIIAGHLVIQPACIIVQSPSIQATPCKVANHPGLMIFGYMGA